MNDPATEKAETAETAQTAVQDVASDVTSPSKVAEPSGPYAVIRTGNKQYRVEPGNELLVEKLEVEAGSTVEIKDVLLFSNGEAISVGRPTVTDVTVNCKCLGHEKGPKLLTIKYRRRKNYKRTYGHRQDLTRLTVVGFNNL